MQTKKCSRCQQEKPVTEYWKRKQLKDGLSSYCKTCWNEINEARKEENYKHQAEYRKKNKMRKRRIQAEYYLEFREEILAKKREKYREEKEKAAKAAKSKTKSNSN